MFPPDRRALGRPAPRIPRPKPGAEAYFGMALTTDSERVALDLWAPLQVLTEYFKRVLPPE